MVAQNQGVLQFLADNELTKREKIALQILAAKIQDSQFLTDSTIEACFMVADRFIEIGTKNDN